MVSWVSQEILKDVKVLFRDPQDSGKCRCLPTPAPEVLANQLDSFVISSWMYMSK